MKNRLLLCAAAFWACACPLAAVAATSGSLPNHSAPAAQHVKAQSAAAHPKKLAAAPIKVAPADEYFGHQKLSILGINNIIHDTNLRIGFDRPHAVKYYGQLEPAEDSLRDWARKYPQDTWLPGRAYYMSHVFWQMHSSDGDAAAERCRAMLFKQFPRSRWALVAQKETRDSVAPLSAADVAAQDAATGAAGTSATGTTAASATVAAPAAAPQAAGAPSKPKR
jgi:hypothetical protein